MEILRKNKFDGWMIMENIYTRPALYQMPEDPFELSKKELAYVKELVSKW